MSDSIDHLDFPVHCPCGRPATNLLEIHAVGFCTPEHPTTSGIRCQICLSRDLTWAQNVADEGGEVCPNCYLRIVTLSDIVVRVCLVNQPGGSPM